jgi:hypothetical protein
MSPDDLAYEHDDPKRPGYIDWLLGAADTIRDEPPC